MARVNVRRLARGIIRLTGVVLVGFLLLIVAAIALVDTNWGQAQLRRLIVGQSHRFLAATLEIDALDGSLFRGIQLRGVRLVQDDRPIVQIKEIALSYSIRELIDQGTRIRSLKVVEPRIAAERLPDGRWNLAAIVKRDSREGQRTGPSRPISIDAIDVVNGSVTIGERLAFGAVRAPTRYQALNASLAFAYEPVGWRIDVEDASFVGGQPDLTLTKLSGRIASSSEGLAFEKLAIATPRSALTVDGSVRRGHGPASLDLDVAAERFVFQEWGGIIEGLKNIAIDSAFTVQLDGPLAALATTLDLQSNGGAVSGTFVLNTAVSGWHAKGRAEVRRIDLAPWFNRPDRPSDLSGRIDFDLKPLFRRFPLGSFTFAGPHVAFLGYQADHFRARGTIVGQVVHIAEATGTAYGADVRLARGTIGVDAPYPFHFDGTANGVDLRYLPPAIPIPHVESSLTFAYDVDGQFSQPFVVGRAEFGPSEFLGASVASGAVGTLDTTVSPFRYSGDGDISGVWLPRFAQDLEIGWLRDPRYEGTMAGHFTVNGTGGDGSVLMLEARGRIARAELFRGTFTDADVTLSLRDGSLSATYDGLISEVNPAVALADGRFDASLTGSGRASFDVRHLLLETPSLDDYTIDSSLTLSKSTLRGVQLDEGALTSKLSGGTLQVDSAQASGPLLDGSASGRVELDGIRSSQLTYDVPRLDLAIAGQLLGREMAGQAATRGTLTGPSGRLTVAGSAGISRLAIGDVRALTTTGEYAITIPDGTWMGATGKVTADATFAQLFGQEVREVSGTLTYDAERLHADVKVSEGAGYDATITGVARVGLDARSAQLESLTILFRDATWQLAGDAPPTIRWDDGGLAVTAFALATANPDQQLAIDGTWRFDGTGLLRVNGRGIYLDAFGASPGRPARFGGRMDIDATIRGTREIPIVTGDVAIVEGRVRRLSYERLAGRVGFADGAFEVDLRLDQAPGTWLTAVGRVPPSVFDRSLTERPLDVTIASSPIPLGLVEGLTSVVRDVSGGVALNLHAGGTSHNPVFTGLIAVSDAAFHVAATGVRYRNGRALLQLTRDRVTVDQLRIEDSGGQALELRGSLGTRALKVGDLEIDASAKRFQVLRNEYGTIGIDADLELRGIFESPRIAGNLTIASGELKIDRIMDRVLFQPYATAAAPPLEGDIDAVAALNPWDRLGLDLTVQVPGTLRLTGDNVQVAEGTPIGLGSFNLRVSGEPYLYKDPGSPMYVTGSLDRVTGSYSFQGRRFELDPNSSINFRGDLNPEPYVMVERVISGVVTRVTIAGTLREPELQFASTPPLESSDILSLIVFNTTVNQLTAQQQSQLATRAVTLGAGFLATSLMTALERSLGLDTLEVAAGDFGVGARVTIGDEIAPGLVARFSRQFGDNEYDEATLEYYLTRILRIRATFSDAGALIARSPFRRVERAGVDLIIFFSF
jgi:autotransporter translocation and assembly factor TamB